jgi:carbon storage regulator
MLVLSRKPGEQIIIADNIRVTVVSVGPGRVKIGIEAPPTVKVDRQEVHDKKQFETAADEPLPHIVETAPALLHNRIAAKLPSARSFPPRKPR